MPREGGAPGNHRTFRGCRVARLRGRRHPRTVGVGNRSPESSQRTCWQCEPDCASPRRAVGAAVKLSAIIITRNEAANIAACLASIAFCDERIVVDCGSSDDTVNIARAAGANVTAHAWEGFGAQKN